MPGREGKGLRDVGNADPERATLVHTNVCFMQCNASSFQFTFDLKYSYSFPHMIDNVWPQFRIGYQLERKQGHWRVALCHTMGVLAGEKYLHELTTSIFTFIHYKMRNFVS